MTDFPKDKDLDPGDVMVTLSIGAEVDPDEAPLLLDGVRRAYGDEAMRRGRSRTCDVILMAVPLGKARPFIDGLMERIANDEGGEIVR